MILTRATTPTTAIAARKAKGITIALTFVLAVGFALTLGAGAAHAVTFTVTNTDDSGAGSLRQAITSANANPNTASRDTINFAIPDIPANECDAAGVCTISPATALPDITEAVVIDGYTQSGASPNTLSTGNNAELKIQLSGVLDSTFASGINITGSNSVVRGLALFGWDGPAVQILGVEASGNNIEGNFIGTDATGSADGVPGNFSGGVTLLSAPNNVVGGTSAAAGNIITNTGSNGQAVQVIGSVATGNAILRNSIFGNTNLGIDLFTNEDDNSRVTPNDPQDPDTGSNNLQNFPVISSATTPDGQSITIEGTLNSTANDAFTIQFFSSPEADPSGFGEGKTYLGQTTVVTNAGGNVTFDFTSSNVPVPAGQVVTATATNSTTRDTSEFSEAVAVDDNTRPTVVSTNPQDGATGVAAGINVRAIFSEQMDPSTINGSTFKLFRGSASAQNRVAATVSYDAANRRAILDPNAPLVRGTRYVARVNTGAEDLVGNGLARQKSFGFTVRN